jgi:hypothetical protein
VAWLLLPVLLLAARPARAQLEASAAVALGATNNNLKVKGAPVEEGGEGGDTNQADGLARSILGLHYLLPGRRSTQTFDYALSTYMYIQREQSVSFANEVGWAALVNPTRFSQLDFSLRGTQGRTGDMDLFRGQALGASEARPTSTFENFASVSAMESLRWELGPFWELGQRLGGELYAPLGSSTRTTPRTLGVEGQLSLSRVWTRDQLGLFAEAGHGRSTEVVFEEPMEGLLGYPARRANWARVGLTYGHAFSDYWSTQVDAGLLGVQVPQIRDPFVDVGLGAAITHRTATRGTIELRGERGIDTNVYVGDVLLQNAIGLRVAHPFGHKESWNLEADLEYQQSKSLFVIDVKETLKVLTAAAILSYDWTRQMRLLLELNFTYQDAEAGLRNTVRSDPFTMHRTMFLVSAEVHYPDLESEAGGGRVLGGRGGSGAEEEEEEASGSGESGGGSGGESGGESGGGSESPP